MSKVPCLALGGLLVAGVPTAFATGHLFDYAVERFEADGNLHGLQNGVPDIVDEFDDGVLGPPQWGVGPGTAVESDGALHLKDPGFDISIPGLSPVSFEVSEVNAWGTPPFVQAGAGDLVVRSYWRPQPLGINHWIHMSMEWFAVDGWHFGGLVLTNFSEPLADLYYPPWPTGYVMTSHHARIDQYGHLEQQEHRTIDSAAITDLIVFELRYDDTNHQITVAFSLDGGTTFQGGFAPIPVSMADGTAGVYLGADPRDGPCPGEFHPQRGVFGNMTPPAGDERMTFKGTLGANIAFSRDGLRVLVTDEGGGATLFDVTIPDGLTVAQGTCDPRDGYVSRGNRGLRYLNYSNALPPACAPGSAEGLRSLDIGWNGTAKVTVKVKKANIPPLTGPVQIALYKPGGPRSACDGYVGQMSCQGGGRTRKCE